MAYICTDRFCEPLPIVIVNCMWADSDVAYSSVIKGIELSERSGSCTFYGFSFLKIQIFSVRFSRNNTKQSCDHFVRCNFHEGMACTTSEDLLSRCPGVC